MYRKDVVLRSITSSNPNDVFLVSGLRTTADVYLRSITGAQNDVFLVPQRYYTAAAAVSSFPTQFFGLRAYYHAAVRDLCLVATADAPGSMGGVLRVQKGGVTYAVYLVETTDPLASPVRVRTTTGTKAIRAGT